MHFCPRLFVKSLGRNERKYNRYAVGTPRDVGCEGQEV